MYVVFPVKPLTPEKISGMLIVSQPIRCKKKKKLTKLDLDFQDSLTELILGGFNCFFKTG